MPYNFKNLIFEGGGVKGIAYGGALKVLDSMHVIPGIVRVAGTSAGAINAALLALGYNFDDVSNIIAGTKFREFQDKSWFIPSNFKRFLFSYGYYKGDAFSKWLGGHIEKKGGKPDLTFGELKAKAGTDNFKELYVIVTNLSQQKAEVISHEKYSNVQIRDAVRMSMSIPFFFQAALNTSKDIMVDGGVSWNYPINLFDYKKYLFNSVNGVDAAKYAEDDDYVFNHETLGLRLDAKEIIEYEKRDWALSPEKITSLKGHAMALINFMMETANTKHLKSNDWNRTIFIDTLNVKTTQFDLSDDEINGLLTSGKVCTENYFKWRDSDPVWSSVPK